MYQAIVFLPLIGAILAGLISLAGARARHPGGSPEPGAENHAGPAVREDSIRGAPSPHGDLSVIHHAHVETHEVAVEPAAGSRLAELITTVFLFIAMILSWIAFVTIGFGQDVRVQLITWIASGDLKVDWALRVDTLTAVMLVVVTTISAFVHLYSIGYMEEDPHRPRFFAYLSLFSFAMLMLVTADNLVQLFFGWEGVGLMSYLLIGFWYHKPEANAAAIKAFIVNRVGDFGFSLGIFAVFMMTGAVDLDTVFAQAPALTGKSIHFLSWNVDALTLICLLLFLGAMGKSSQFLLHTWLPDAMEGPTPVSALIHAATMVAAWISADTGVGPSIASGSQVCSRNCADLPIAPMNSSRQIRVSASTSQARKWMVLPVSDGACANSVPNSTAPVSMNTAKMPSAKPKSPMRLTMKALIAAALASGL